MSIINKLHTLGVNNTLECSVTILDLNHQKCLEFLWPSEKMWQQGSLELFQALRGEPGHLSNYFYHATQSKYFP